jgi:DNA polymerase III delta subunit
MDWEQGLAAVADPARPLPGRWWIAGTDRYRIETWRQELRRRLGPDVEERVIEGPADASELALWLGTEGFFADSGARLLWWSAPDARSAEGPGWAALTRAADERHVLVIWVEKGPAPKGFWTVSADPPKPAEWPLQVRRMATRAGLDLSPAALEVLARVTQFHGHQVEQAAHVLALAQAAGESVTPRLVEQLVPPLEIEAVWVIGDALVARDAVRAWREVRRQLGRGAEPVRLLGVMVRPMALLTGWLEARSRGTTASEYQNRHGLKPWQWRPLQRAADRWTLAEATAWFDRAARADAYLKRSALNAGLWVESLALAVAPSTR